MSIPKDYHRNRLSWPDPRAVRESHELAGGGAAIVLYREPRHSEEDILACVREALADDSVTSVTVVKTEKRS